MTTPGAPTASHPDVGLCKSGGKDRRIRMDTTEQLQPAKALDYTDKQDIETLQWLSGQYLPGGPRDVKRAIRSGIAGIEVRSTAEAVKVQEFNRGVLIAVSTLLNCWGGQSTQAEHLLAMIHATPEMVEAMGFTDFDGEPLLRALASDDA